MSRARLAFLLLFIVGLLAVTAGGMPPASAAGSARLAPHVPGEILIKFRPGARGIERASVMAQLNAQHVTTFREGGEHWRLGPGWTVERAIQSFSRNPNVEHVEPNYILGIDVIPNDPNFPDLYGMLNTGQTGGTADADIDADQAWGVSTGSHSVVVGVIDTGVNHLHPDLAANIWTNPGEIPGNNLDDDNNGFVDDVHGYDFVNNDGDPMDDHGHGSHVSGTIGAVGNNGIGVVGVNWQVSIMGLKFLSASGSGSTANAVRAVNYATMMGVDLTSNSWGGGAASTDLQAAIAAAGAQEIPFIAAAGNNGTNNDTSPHYPSNYDLANVISVAATDDDDRVASFSNYGAVSVDLAAPGVDIQSTVLGSAYDRFSGTSMATPHVAGAAALLKSRFPNLPAAQLKFALMNFTDKLPQLSPTQPPSLPPGVPWRPVASGGRLNVFFSIADPDTVPPGGVTDLAAPSPGSNHMGLTWRATGDDGDTGTATSYQVRYSTSPIDETNFDAATRATGAPNPGPPGTFESMDVTGLSADTPYYFAVRALDEWGNAGLIADPVLASTLPPPTAGYTPSSISDSLFTGGQSDHTVTLRNDGMGTLDFTIPTPALSEPYSTPAEPLILGKDEPDPRTGDPVLLGAGGPDAFGYRWIDSNEPGGPAFSWQDISTTGTLIGDVTTDDDTSAAIPLGFNFVFYGTPYNSIRVCSNGWLSFTSSATTYTNQALPTTAGPENMIAPFWDDLNPGNVARIYFQNLGNRAIVQWHNMPKYNETGSSLTFQAILEASGAITFQYLSLNATITSSTVGIQNTTRTIGLTTAFNTSYLANNLAIRYTAIPQWLSAAPASGRIPAGGSTPVNVHLDASGLEGGTYPGTVRILTNDPNQPELAVNVTLQVTGAPDATVSPAAIDFGDVFLNVPFQRMLTVSNAGTDDLHVNDVQPGSGELAAAPVSFTVAPHFSTDVTITLTGSALGPFSGSVTVHSDDASEPAITVPVTANVLPAPIVVVNPASFEDTLYSGDTSTHTLTISNTGGSDLVVTTSADQGNGGTGITTTDPAAEGQGGPDAFGYRWRDSDALGGPAYNFVDIGTTGTPITFSSQDNAISPLINMGMTFPFYGTAYQSLKVSTNGWLTFDPNNTLTASSNAALPTTSLGRAAIAMFWDNLHIRSGNVRYLNDGLRFIVQFTNVGLSTPTTGQSFTFQVQLYPNGRILLMYQTMVGTLNSATIGIQNFARDIGLQVVHQTGSGTPYVHDNLALEIKRTPDWLSVTPAGATIPPGGSSNFDVTFDATDRAGGILNGNVVINTNIPNQATIPLPATLNVIGAPNVISAPAAHPFGIVYIGYPQLRPFQVFNDGTDVLNVSNVDTTDPFLTVEEEPGPTAGFTLAPGVARLMFLRWSPASVGPLDAHLRIHSDDPDNPTLLIPVTGTALQPPVAAVTPASITDSLVVGGEAHHPLRLENQGNSDLNFTTSVRLVSGASVTVYPEMEEKGEWEDEPGILGLGGPDSFGYVWRDSNDPMGPVFDWTDISGIGTPVAGLDGDDENIGPVPIGFPFSFYGNTFTQVRVGTNGFLTFDSTLTAVTNQPLPNSSTSVPTNLLAAFWDDLEFRSVERARYHNDGSRFIVQYTDVDRVGTTGNSHLTFQVILYPNGRIVYQYLTMNSPTLTSATIGIQNGTRTDGLTVVHNAAYVHDGLAIEFAPPFVFPSIAPPAGTVPSGGSMDLDVLLDASGLTGGDYAAFLDVSSNDPARGLISIPVSLHVSGVADLAVQPASLSFLDTFVDGSAMLSVVLHNAGNDVLQISGITAAGDYGYSGATAPVALGVNGSLTLTVTFHPTAPGARPGSLAIASNDPGGDVVIPLSGNGLLPPIAVWNPGSFAESLDAGDIATRTLHLENQGASDLMYSVALRANGAPVPIYDEIILKEGEVDPRPGILGTGGPDNFGYTWRDSDEPAGPVFDWVDISGVGTQIDFNDPDGYCVDCTDGPFPIGFSFPYYGTSFSTINVTTEGWVSFTSTLKTASNQPLPNTGTSVPENVLAAFWDDLVLRNGSGSEPVASSAWYHNDGSRFIVQWKNFYRIADYNDDLNFQIILYPNGRIVYQYLLMANATLNSATIGQQNAEKNDGLTIVHNMAYMHDGLAIEIRPAVSFLTVSPTDGVLPPGGSVDLGVTFDTEDLVGGDYLAFVELITNDPLRSHIDVPVSLHVTDATDIEALPASLSFPVTYAGFGSSLPVTLHNRGSLELMVNSISASGPFSVTGAATPPFSLDDNESVQLTVTFSPPGEGSFNGELTIASNDPDEPSLAIPLSGTGLIPPEIDTDPDAISTALPPGGVRTKTLMLYNNGGSDLSWTTGANIISAIQPGTYLELDKEEDDPRPGILGTGGPDMFGYRWKDSDEPGGPLFDWVDISGIGTPIAALTGDDQSAGPFPIGFSFPFYGNTFGSVYVKTNGFLSFTSTATSLTNQSLPNSSSSVPENLLAVFWDDLHFRSAVRAHYHNDGNRFIVQYTDVDRFSTTQQPSPAHLTFQVILYPNGKIRYQYLTMYGFLTSATIGIQNQAKDDGLTVVFNSDYMHDNLAIEFAPLPEWISASPGGGVIPPGGSQALAVLLNAAGLEDGIHEATIDVSSNDPYTPMVHVPVTLNVSLLPTAYLNFDPDALNLSANGNTIKMVIELPAGYDPHMIDVASITLNDTVHALPSPVEYTDENLNGVEEIVVKFDRAEVDAVLPEGTAVPVTIQCEVADVQWFRGTTTARTMRPRLNSPNGAEYLMAGQIVPVTWDAVSAPGNIRYNVYLTRDGGTTYELLAENVNGTSHDWTVGGTPTSQARVRVVALDNEGVMGYDASDADFTIAAQPLPPNDVGDTLDLMVSGSDVVLQWKRPLADATHGPVDHYRVFRSLSANGPFVQVAVTPNEEFREPLASEGTIVYYKVIAVNSAGESLN